MSVRRSTLARAPAKAKELPDFSTQAPGVRRVVELGFEDILWGYGEPPKIEPRMHFGRGRSYGGTIDPMPCHAHDAGLVAELLEECGTVAPLCNPVTVSVVSLQDPRGSNGWAQQQWDHGDEMVIRVDPADGKESKRQRNWDGIILLSGRTTEIHPAIARYVVPHEYAHIVEDALGIIRYPFVGDGGRQVVRDWGKVRGIPDEAWTRAYTPPNHHLMPGEIFANDFRCYVMQRESDWWPHNDVVPQLGKRGTIRAQRWWDAAIAELSDCYRQATA